jgi:lysophospholipase L1-like esterase
MKTKKALLALGSLIFSLLLAAALLQVYLMVSGWRPVSGDGYLQFGYRTGIPVYDEDGLLKEGQPVRVRLFQSDPVLFWKPIAGTAFTNSAGFRGRRDFAKEKPAGTLRIGYLGDSCTFLGDPLYPDIVAQELSRRLGRKVDAINAAVPGYTSYQGVRRVEQLIPYHPDYVCVYFGWNDHWPGQGGLTDRAQHALSSSIRLFAYVRLALVRFHHESVPRVSLDDYRSNLETIAKRLQEAGIQPVFITAPMAYRQGEMPPWAYAFFKQFYGMSSEEVSAIPDVHIRYADVVRELCREDDLPLVDAQADFERLGPEAPKYFRNDGIHLRTPGHTLLARLIERVIVSQEARRKAGLP